MGKPRVVWVDDVVWTQRVSTETDESRWWADVSAVYSAGGLRLENTGIVDAAWGNGGVRWTDLVVWLSGAGVGVAQCAALASDPGDLPHPAHAGSFRWLRRGPMLVTDHRPLRTPHRCSSAQPAPCPRQASAGGA